MPSTRGTNAPRRSKRVTEVEKQQAKLKAQQAAKATAAAAAAAKKKAAAKKPKVEEVVADVKKKAGKVVKEVKKQVVKPAAKKVAKAAGVDTKPTKATATKSKKADDKTTAKAKKATTKTAATKGKKKSSTSKAVSAPKPAAAAPKKRAPPKARGTAAASTKKPAADEPKKEESAAVTPYKVGDIVEDVTLQNGARRFFPLSERVTHLFVELSSLRTRRGRQACLAQKPVRGQAPRHLLLPQGAPRDRETRLSARAPPRIWTRFLTSLSTQADTPGCTIQACGYRDIRNEYEEHGAIVIGLSCDKPTAQIKWKSKNELGYSLLSDPKADLLLKKLGWSDKSKCVRGCPSNSRCRLIEKLTRISSAFFLRLPRYRSTSGAATGSSRRVASSQKPSSASSPPTTPRTRAYRSTSLRVHKRSVC